jgi:hypothetical protein
MLTTTAKMGTDEVEEICGLGDGVYRNCWITFGYWNLSEQLHQYIGDNASWCTFARWSSFTVGQNLRLDENSPRVTDVFSKPLLKPFRNVAQELYRDVRELGELSMPTILAQGNQLVFHEIGHAVASFIEWYESKIATLSPRATKRREDLWQKYRETITGFERGGDLFRIGDVTWLRDGLENYFRAMAPGISAEEQGRRVLRGNIYLAAYEQWRLDPIIRIALDPFAKHLVEFRALDPHREHHAAGDYPHAVWRRRGTKWADRHESSIRRWISDQYAAYLTKNWMSLEIPINDTSPECVVVGKGIHHNHANGAFPRMRRLDDPELFKLLAIYDHNPTREIVGAQNWNSYTDRMQFIVEMFLALQKKQQLYQPIESDEMKLLQLDLDREHLDSLRRIGDDEMDHLVEQYCSTSSVPPRDLVREIIRSGASATMRIDRDLPPWASEAKLKAGQDFFREYAVQIATALFSASLPLSYTAEHGARVLTATAELASGNVNRRVAETGKLLLDIMTIDSPDATPLARGSAGWRAAAGVRTFHAAIRQMLLNNRWDTTAHGVPVNQEDLIGTLVLFTVAVVDALKKMGVTVKPEERDAYVHLWMVVGYLLGIDYSLIHREVAGTRSDAELTFEELRVLGDVLQKRNSRMNPDGQQLSASLMGLFRQSISGPLGSFPAAATRILIGDEQGDLLDIPTGGAPARVVIRTMRPLTRLVSRGRAKGLVQRGMHGSTTKLYHDWIATQHGDRPPWVVDDPKLRAKLRLNGNAQPLERRHPTRTQIR